MNAYDSVTGFLEETIERSGTDHDYVVRCVEEAADLRIKDLLMKLASIEDEIKSQAQTSLMEIKAQREMEEAIVESYEHF